MEYGFLSIFDSVLDWQWDKAAAFLGFWIALFTLSGILGARIPRFQHWLGIGVQGVLGISDLGKRLSELGQRFEKYVERNEAESLQRDQAITKLAKTVEAFVQKDIER